MFLYLYYQSYSNALLKFDYICHQLYIIIFSFFIYQVYIIGQKVNNMDIKSNTQSSSKSIKLQGKTSQTNSVQNNQTPDKRLDNSPLDYERKQSKLTIGGLTQTRRSSHLSVTPRRILKNQGDEEEKSSRVDSFGPSNGSTVYDEAVSRYQCIASLTEEENKNLKDQNIYLLQKLRKMQERESKVKILYEKAKKYKILWQEAQMQIEVLREQCEVYKQQAEEMKKIILNDVTRLNRKINQTQFRSEKDIDSSINQDSTIQISKNSKLKSQASNQSKHSLSKYLKPYTQTI